MNQKRITNQILTQELSLNSTLNYLFNISNMKKLFSYLLISSMVVLSSCTNYDDQFDDLNSQINSLKGQIEGFSSLSSGLTALQGTVASLQSAVANIPVTPATDISGLESSLETLAASVAELQTALANAATAAEVAALETSLAAVQSDLAELLASNNVYTGNLTINTGATLTAAEALGGKLAIINGDVTISQTASNGVDSAKLQAVVDQIVTITGNLNYTQSGTGVTAVNFSKLSGVTNLTVNQEAAVSFPELASAAVVAITANSKVTSVSAPKLATVTSFNSGSISFTSAESIDLSALKFYNAALTVATKNNGSVMLNAFENVDADGDATAHALTINGASTFTAPKLTAGVLTLEKVATVSLPLYTFASGSVFSDAKSVVLPSVKAAKTADLSIAVGTAFPKAEDVHIKAASNGTKTVSVSVSQNNVKTLKLEGTLKAATITSATDLVDLDITATVGSLQVSNTDIVNLSIGSTLDKGSLVVTNNADLESITGATVDNVKTLTITDNENLESISFAALKTAQKGSVTIEKNNLTIDKITEKSLTGATVTVARKVETSDFKDLVTFLGAAKTAGSSVVVKATDSTGAALVTSVVTALGADTSVKSGDEIIMNWVPANQASNAVAGKNHVEEWLFTAIDADVEVVMDGFATTIVNTGGSVFNDIQSWADLDANKTKFTNGGYTVTYGRSVKTGDITFSNHVNATATYKITVNGKSVTTTVANSTANHDVLNALYAKLGSSHSDVFTSALFTVTTATNKLKFETLRKGSPAPSFSYSIAAYEDAALTTNTSNAVFSTTVNALTADNNQVWVQLSADTAGAAGVKATSVSSSGAFTRTSLTASGTNTGDAATGDDNANVQAATEGTAQTNSSTVTANSVDNTGFIG